MPCQSSSPDPCPASSTGSQNGKNADFPIIDDSSLPIAVRGMNAFKKNQTWVYKVKQNADGTVERLMARLVAKGYNQTYGLNYQDTFASIAKMNLVMTRDEVSSLKSYKARDFEIKNLSLFDKEEVFSLKY
ncbi:hypothetical protein RJ639_034359 [Escallonia herrerae]|uniref:Reverse transcriptase Ty1/copia-type domain-containing protein n=1 Tax=Escallonia herrerae TaxID=1293975 RepID=A0AA88WYY8_9ASTE|nr:hypothetical protein RJ639_034359 [Escallonia herrerae]